MKVKFIFLSVLITLLFSALQFPCMQGSARINDAPDFGIVFSHKSIQKSTSISEGKSALKVDSVSNYDSSLGPDSIISPDYSLEADMDKWDYDPKGSTLLESTGIYKDGKISLLIYDITYKSREYKGPEQYILKHYIEKPTGEIISLPDVKRQDLLKNWKKVNYGYPVPLQKSFYLPAIETDGARPLMPDVSFEENADGTVNASLFGSADLSLSVYHYGYEKADPSGKDSKDWPGPGIEPGSYAMLPLRGEIRLIDYMTGFAYSFDKNKECSAPDGNWKILQAESSSDPVKNLSLTIPKEIYDSKETIYMHVSSISYTGLLSPVRTVEVPRKPVYFIHFDRNDKKGINGTIKGSMPDMEVKYTDIGIAENRYVNTSTQSDGNPMYSFVGWSLEPDQKEPLIYAGYDKPDDYKDYPMKDLVDRSGLKDKPGSLINLYAVWDKAPEVEKVRNIYFTKDQAEKGINPVDILSKIRVRDREDGLLSVSNEIAVEDESSTGSKSDAEHKAVNNQSKRKDTDVRYIDTVRLVNYKPKDMMISGNIKTAELNALAMDRALNKTYFSIRVIIYSNRPIDASDGGPAEYIRFIDKKNYDKEYKKGGLLKYSVWRNIDAYKKELTRALSQIERDKPDTGQVVKLNVDQIRAFSD